MSHGGFPVREVAPRKFELQLKDYRDNPVSDALASGTPVVFANQSVSANSCNSVRWADFQGRTP